MITDQLEPLAQRFHELISSRSSVARVYLSSNYAKQPDTVRFATLFKGQYLWLIHRLRPRFGMGGLSLGVLDPLESAGRTQAWLSRFFCALRYSEPLTLQQLESHHLAFDPVGHQIPLTGYSVVRLLLQTQGALEAAINDEYTWPLGSQPRQHMLTLFEAYRLFVAAQEEPLRELGG